MKRILLVVMASAIFTSEAIAAKTTYYCAPTSQINFSAQPVSYAPYLYTSPQLTLPQGIQPSLVGWGSAHQAVNMISANWTDASLACNYHGLTDQLESETMVMVSESLGDEIHCNFPNNKPFCNSSDPYDCPLMCENQLYKFSPSRYSKLN